MDCRGQSYDNAYNVAGTYTGLQKRIIEVNILDSFFPSTAHSLVLAAKNAAAKNTKAADVFNFLENLYLFFVRAPARWKKFQAVLSFIELALKRSTGAGPQSTAPSKHFAYPTRKYSTVFIVFSVGW